MRYDDYGWLSVAVGVAVIDALAPRGHTLSHGFARYRRQHPAVTAAVVGGLLAHLYGTLPAQVDPLHRVGALLGKSDLTTNEAVSGDH